MLTFSSNTLIAYERHGAGEPALMLLPDWGMPRRVFAPVLDLAARRRRVLSLDWRGHGESGRASADFGHRELADDAEAVMAASGVGRVVLVAHGQAGWPAIELRRRLSERIAGMVLIDWQVFPAHPRLLAQLRALSDAMRWRRTLDAMIEEWFDGLSDRRLRRIMGEMRFRGHDLWSRAARAIAASYAGGRSPLQALAAIEPPPVLHLAAGAADDDDLDMLHAFADLHPWYDVERITERGHLPMFAAPELLSATIERFVTQLAADAEQRGIAAAA